jgi:hypothetical protein
MWLAVTTTSLDDAMRAGTRFSQLLNLRVFQQYLRIPAIALYRRMTKFATFVTAELYFFIQTIRQLI